MQPPRSAASVDSTHTSSGATALTRYLLCAVLTALGCWISIYTRQSGMMSTIWIASGVLAGLLVTSPRALWGGSILVSLLANAGVRAAVGDPWLPVIGRSVASTLDAVFVAWALAHYVGDVTAPGRIRLVSRIAIGSTVIGCAASAAIASAAQWLFDGSPILPFFGTWFASHVLGMVIFATLTVVASAQGERLFGRPGHRIDLAVTTLLTALISYWVFSQTRYPLLFFVYPPLLLGAFRHRFPGVVMGVFAITVIAVAETHAGHGPMFLIPHAGSTERILLMQLFIASTCLLTIPVAVVLTDRSVLLKTLRESERRYRILADYSRDLVVRLSADGEGLYVSPSAEEMLGWDPTDFASQRMQLVHPDDARAVTQATRNLLAQGGTATLSYRVRHRLGHYVWIESNARRVPGENGGAPEIIYVGRDVSRRVEAEAALRYNQRRLHAITDNLPALVVHVDTDLRYTFANAKAGVVLGRDPAEIIGKPIREVLPPKYYEQIIGAVEAALRGEPSEFGIEREFGGERYHYQTSIVPDIETDGSVVGFYVMSSDVSQLKRTEHELKLLARYDSLTGLANRFHFNEHTSDALARHRRSGKPIALLYMDIDRFKQINDSHGHAVGDEVLREFAQRVKGCLRVSDFAARLGGDEFVVLVEDADGPEAPETIARKMKSAMREPVATAAAGLRVTTSIGIAFCPLCPADREALLLAADKALYAAKAAGRDTWRTQIVDADSGAGDPQAQH